MKVMQIFCCTFTNKKSSKICSYNARKMIGLVCCVSIICDFWLSSKRNEKGGSTSSSKVSSLKYKAITNCTTYFTFLAFCWKLFAVVESGNIATYSSESESAALKDTLKSIISRYHTISVWITWSSVLNCLDDIAELVNERAPLLKTNFDRCEADLAESICFNLFSCCCNCVRAADTLISVWYTSQYAKFTDFFDGLIQG